MKNKLIDIFNRYKKNIFLIDPRLELELTYEDFDKYVKKTICFLEKQAIKEDRIIVISNNEIETTFIYFAALYLNKIVIPINPHFSHEDIEYIIETSGSDTLLFTNSNRDRIETLKIDKKICYEFNEINNCSLSNYTSFQNYNEYNVDFIFFTSGTTGRPKGVMNKVKNLVNNGEKFSSYVGLSAKDRLMSIFNLTYLGGYYNMLMMTFINGASLVLDDAFNIKMMQVFFQNLQQYNVSILWLNPTVINILNEFDRNDDHKVLLSNNIRYVLSGTAPLLYEDKLKFENKYSLPIYNNYGLSETTFIATQGSSFQSNPKSVGKIYDDINIEFENVENNIGEIKIKTPYLMSDYLNNHEENCLDGWFKTGDLGYLENGDLFITGRKKDLIIKSGQNISPMSIECVIKKHNSVSSVAVVGKPHKLYGEEIIAYIVLSGIQDQKLVKNDIMLLCRAELHPVKIPANIVFLESMPLNANGKIDRKQLKEL